MPQLLDTIENDVLQGGYLIDWHACDLFPKSWIDLVVVLRCPSTSILYDRLSARCVYPRDFPITKSLT
jgi:adenylate kinase